MRVSRRVSMPAIAGTPFATRNSLRPCCARQLERRTGTSRTTSPAANTLADSMSSALVPVLPTCGCVSVTIWRQYDGSVRISWYPVIAVLKTISPEARPGAPPETPRNVVPSANTSRAGAVSVGRVLILAARRAERDRLAPVPLDECESISRFAGARQTVPKLVVRSPTQNANLATLPAPESALSAEFLPQRVSLLYRLSGKDVPAISIVSLIAAFALWGYISDALLAAWLVWLVVASLVRIGLNRAYALRRPGPEDAQRWEGYFCLTSAAVGAAWGLTVMLLYPARGQLHEVLLPFLIGSVAMGLPPALAPSPKAFACLIVPIFAPMIGLLFSQGGAFNTSAGILILVFAAVLLALYLSSNRALTETLTFGRENARLLEEVKEAKERLDLALHAANILIWDWDARRASVFLGGSWASILGAGKEAGTRTMEQLAEIVHPEDQARVRETLI